MSTSTERGIFVFAFTCKTFVGLRGSSRLQENSGRYCAAAATLFDADELDVEDQRGVWRNDAAGAAGAIAELGRNDQRALAADLHGRDAFVPAGDDLVHADLELERLVAIDRGVEFLALGGVLIKPAGVMHDAGLAGFRRGAGAGLGVDDFQSGGRGHDGLGSGWGDWENGDNGKCEQSVAARKGSHADGSVRFGMGD